MNSIRISLAGALWLAVCCPAMSASEGAATPEKHSPMVKMDDAKFNDWLTRWDKNITGDARNRYCDKAIGEDIGWLMTPFMDGFYYGYMATKDPRWVAMLVDWTDSWVKRAVKEPDGYLGWPRPEAAGTKVDNLDDFNADSMLGEAMALRPAILMAGEILKTPALKEKYGVKAESYIKLSEKIYEKWDERGGWRETKDGAVISVVLPYGIDRKTGNWTEGYARRNAPGNGFSHPNNKANHVARWLLAMSEATGKAVYKERAEKWFMLMKSRMKRKASGTYEIWNYWEPAGPWDYKPNGSPKHWVGVHPNPGYYQIDLTGIVDAYDHGLVFTRQDIEHLIATAIAEKRYWDALVPYSETIQRKFEEGMKPDSWGGLSAAAKYLMLQSQLHEGGRLSAATHRRATYYVDQGNPVANDSNPGAAAQPWKTIQQAADTVTAGDTVIVKTGTYAEQVGIFAPHAGTPGHLITLKAAPGDKVVIDGGKKNSFGFRMGASHIRIEGFEIVNVTGHGILAGWSDGSSLGVEIVNNTVHDCGFSTAGTSIGSPVVKNPDTAAIYYAGGSGGLIQGNHLYENAGDGITFPNIAGGITIRNNRIHHNEVDGIKGGGGGLIVIEGNTINNMTSALHHGDGMQLMGMKGTLVVRNNTVWDCTQDIYCDDYSQPAGLQPWGDVYIYNNVVYNTKPRPKGTGGFWNGIVTGTRYNSWRSVTVCHNTLVNCNDGSGGVSVAVVGPTAGKIGAVRVLNNLFYNSTNNVAVGSLASRGSTIDMDCNGYYNQWRDWYLGDGWRDLAKFRAAHPEFERHGFYSTKVLFARDTLPDPDYHLVADSAAIGKGASIPPIGEIRFDEDKDGNPRPQDAGWDLGAYRYMTKSTKTPLN